MVANEVEMDGKTLGATGRTHLVGVMADPVAQARAIDVGNALLQARGLSAAFIVVPLQVDEHGLGAMVTAMRSIKNLAGTMVSMPNKQRILPLLDSYSAEAELFGAVNVVRRTADGRLEGHMLDGEGFVSGLVRAGHPVRDRTCLLAGAGGAASAIAFALVRSGCRSLTIVNRTRSRAEDVAYRVRESYPGADVRVGDIEPGRIDIAINGTSLGMRPSDGLPLNAAVIPRCGVVAECVIAPEMTPLLQLAQQHGCAVHKGIHMLQAQIDELLAFMGIAAPE